MSRPLIGISTSELRTPDRVDTDPTAEPPQRELALGLDYPTAVVAGGGMPVVLPPYLEDAGSAVAHLDGLLLSGGHDLDPALYAQPRHPELGPLDPGNDRWELSLLTAAVERDIPVLAICRGMQLLNVSRGGSLWQDLPSDLGLEPERHRQVRRGSVVTHEVDVVPGTLLERLTGGGRLSVNTFHHQAVRDLGGGLVVSARDPDGLVEAVEDPDLGFLLGVQWHAESLHARPEARGLFTGLVEAARARHAAGHAD